ncbi:MAG: isocitrate/isopropylmalate family dehydrogenase [Xanthobacteraceae bacterium]
MAERGQQIPPTSFRVDGGMAGVAHGGDPASSQGINTRQECLRVIRFALDYDVRQGRKKVTVVQKANVLKALTGIFLEAGRQVAKEYAGSVEMNDRIVDACTMQLVMTPWQFDVIVTTNLFGDILSDQMAGLVGGLGMAPGANIARPLRSSKPSMDRHRTLSARVLRSAGIAARCLPDAGLVMRGAPIG